MYFLSATNSKQFPHLFSQTKHFSSNPVSHQQSTARKEGKHLVLVVDDVPDIAFMLAAYLERAGYRVVSVFSASEALVAVRAERFDAIISDIGLPVMDGYQLAKELRSLPNYVTTPLIAVTGFTEYSDQQKAFTAGFDAHLKKPIDPEKIIDLMAHLGC